MAIIGSLMQIAFWAIILPTAFYLLTQTVSTLIYSIGVMFFGVMDLLQSTFRKLAGLGGNVSVGGEKTDDLVTALLSNDTIIDVLIAVTVFAIGLIIVASIVQMIRLEYTTEGSKNSKEQIFAKAGKSLIMFILVPIICFVGIRVSNYLLVAIDYATSSAGASTVSGCVFTSAASEASKVYDPDRNNAFHIDISNLLGSLILNNISGYGKPALEDKGIKYFDKWFKYTGSSNDTSSKGEIRSVLADQVAQAFCSAELTSSGMLNPGRALSDYDGENPATHTTMQKWDRLSYMNADAVLYFYHLGNINYLILFLGCYFGIKTLFTACMGLIARLYKIAALFVISPAAIGLQPLDDGAAYKKWRGEFIKNVLSCYGIVVALNLYFVIVGVLQTVELWPGWWNYVPNKFVQFMMVLTGATMINDLASTMGSLIGAGDVMADGAKATSEVGKLASGVNKIAGGAVGGASRAIAGKIQAGFARRQRGKDGKASLAATEKSAGMSDKDIEQQSAAATKDYDDYVKKLEDSGNFEYDEKTGRLYNKDANGNRAGLATGSEAKKLNKLYKKKNENSEEELRKKRSDAQTALKTDEFYGQQKTKVAQGRAEAMMGRAAMGSALNPMQMFSGFDNLMGGISKYTSGEAFKATDEKTIENLKKQGVDTDALGLKPGKNSISAANDAFGGVFGLKKKKEAFQTNRVNSYATMAAENNTNRDMMASADAALGQEQQSAEAAAAEAAAGKQKLQNTAANVGKTDGYQTASEKGTAALTELKKLMEQFMAGEINAASLKHGANQARSKVQGIDAGEKGAAEQLINDVINGLNNNIGATAQKNAINAQMANFSEANITAKLQDANTNNVNGGYGTTADRAAYQGLSEAETAANARAQEIKNNRENLVNEAANYAAHAQTQKTDQYGRPVVDKDGKPEMIDANFTEEFAKRFAELVNGKGLSGGDNPYNEAMKNLAETLKNEGIKAKLDLDESKFKIDDENIVKSLKDILMAVQATKDDKKDDGDSKTLQEILKQLKKNGKS